LKALQLSVKLRFSILAIILFATGCQPSKTAATSPAEGMPANAILVGDQLFMVPIGKDKTGCQMYRAFSPKHSVVAAIFYKGGGGKFLIDKGKSDCK
jgi:hypothetical protein